MWYNVNRCNENKNRPQETGGGYFVCVKLTGIEIKGTLKFVSKLDEVKEILNTLRVAMSLSFGLLIVVVSGIIKRFDDNNVDAIF